MVLENRTESHEGRVHPRVKVLSSGFGFDWSLEWYSFVGTCRRVGFCTSYSPDKTQNTGGDPAPVRDPRLVLVISFVVTKESPSVCVHIGITSVQSTRVPGFIRVDYLKDGTRATNVPWPPMVLYQQRGLVDPLCVPFSFYCYFEPLRTFSLYLSQWPWVPVPLWLVPRLSTA